MWNLKGCITDTVYLHGIPDLDCFKRQSERSKVLKEFGLKIYSCLEGIAIIHEVTQFLFSSWSKVNNL